MIDPFLFEILACPETRTSLTLAAPEIVLGMNAAIEKGTLQNRGGRRITEKVQAALVRVDNEVAYPVRDDIPDLRIDEQINLRQLK